MAFIFDDPYMVLSYPLLLASIILFDLLYCAYVHTLKYITCINRLGPCNPHTRQRTLTSVFGSRMCLVHSVDNQVVFKAYASVLHLVSRRDMKPIIKIW